MTVHLNQEWRRKLASLPETGMGFQVVDILLKGGRWLKGLSVFNGEECQTQEKFEPAEVVDVRLHKK